MILYFFKQWHTQILEPNHQIIRLSLIQAGYAGCSCDDLVCVTSLSTQVTAVRAALQSRALAVTEPQAGPRPKVSRDTRWEPGKWVNTKKAGVREPGNSAAPAIRPPENWAVPRLARREPAGAPSTQHSP